MSQHHLLFSYLSNSLLHRVSGYESVDHDPVSLPDTMGSAERLQLLIIKIEINYYS